MLLITRAIVAAAVIVGTVVLSLGASFGLSVLLWQHILGIELQFMVMAMAVIILLAVGADYNLLLVARMKEEIPAGINTGIIRAMGGSGSVVTAAGLVFAFTMISMSVSAMVVVAQVGTTIGLGLLFDTLVVRAFMTPAIAALMVHGSGGRASCDHGRCPLGRTVNCYASRRSLCCDSTPPRLRQCGHRRRRLVLPQDQKTIVWFPSRMMRSSQCHSTARERTARSTSAPRRVRSLTSWRWSTRTTSCSMIGPSSRVAVT